MRAGVADAVRAGAQARALGPIALVSMLTAAAFTPLLVPLAGGAGGGEIGAVLGQVGGIGGGYIATVLTNFSECTRRHVQKTGETATEESIRGELADQIALALQGEAGNGLRAEVAAVLRGVDAIGAALAADRDHALAPGLAALGEQMANFRWVLSDLGVRLSEVQRILREQGVSQRSHILAARGELETITALLQRVVAAREALDPAPAVTGQSRKKREACPYPGLRPFESGDARWFFGRHDLTAHLVARLAGQLGTGSPLFVLGPSGAGKSSLLRAGLIPWIGKGLLGVPGSRRWPRVLLSRPGARPAAALADALAGRDPAARLVLVVDQVEDIFTQCDDPAERLRFVRELLALAARGALVVAGVRADFYADCATIDELRPLLPDNQLVVGPMSEAELRLAITGRAAARHRRSGHERGVLVSHDRPAGRHHRAPADQVNAAAFTPDGRGLITASADGTARVWDLNSADEVKALCGRDRCPGGPARPRQEPRRRGDGHPDARHERHRSHPDDHSRRRSGTCRHPHHLR